MTKPLVNNCQFGLERADALVRGNRTGRHRAEWVGDLVGLTSLTRPTQRDGTALPSGVDQGPSSPNQVEMPGLN